VSKVDDWLKSLAILKMGQKERTEALLKVEGLMEGIGKNAPQDSLQQVLAFAFQLIAKLTRVDESDTIFLLETFLTLLAEQQKEIDTLNSITSSLASEKKELSKKFRDMDKWRKERESMLTEIDDFVKQRREFLDQNR